MEIYGLEIPNLKYNFVYYLKNQIHEIGYEELWNWQSFEELLVLKGDLVDASKENLEF